MFTGYQCPDCYNMEGQLVQILAARNDVAVSIKHFPFCADCNPGIKKTTHPNGCWAARAAEAAGILWGAEGFWKMHNWLFSQRGLFETEDALKAGIRSIGFDPTGFVEVMTSDETLRRVQADCREAISLGLNFTPMIFINGVELKGWNAPDALKRAVAAVAATNPPARTAADDHPPTALEKYLADWREQPQRPLPSGKRSWTLGSPDAPYKILLLGDYQEPFTALADQFIRQFVSEHPYTQYTFRHYPVNKECNPQVPDVRHPLACRAAQAAEAAGVLGGPNAFWKLHAWLMEHPKEFNDQALQAAAAQIGLDPGALLVTMATPEVQAAIADDITMGQQMGLQNVPWIIVDGRWVPRWLLEGEDVLGRIVNEAAAKYAPQP